jgi:hypothetical protein
MLLIAFKLCPLQETDTCAVRVLAKLAFEEVLLIGMHCSGKLQPKPYIIYTNCDNIQQAHVAT